LLEGFVKKIVDIAKAHMDVWNSTAILVTMDEGGGYYDSAPTLCTSPTCTPTTFRS
jgi:phospholipase C